MTKEKAAHQVLARKYRPQGFGELIGQPAVEQTLRNALASGRVHHAYLFTGPRGCGKTTTARILAKALNCAKGPTAEPCGDCQPCREIAQASCLDVMEMDAASNTGVEDVRQTIIETVGLAPARDRYKVFIIDETHMLSNAAFNALLKTIEEPPPNVVFILATTEVHKVPATIASRCQRFKFRPVSPEPLAEHLAAIAKKEKIAADPEALRLLARVAEGSLRDAVSLLDQCRSAGADKVTPESVREMFGFVPQEMLLGAARALLGRDEKALAGWLKKIYEEGVEPAQFLRDLRAALESVYLEKLGVGGLGETAWSEALADATAESLNFLLRRLNRALEELRFGDSPRLALELGLFSALEAAHDLSAWAARLEALEKRLAAGGGGPSLARPAASAPGAVPPSRSAPAVSAAAPAPAGSQPPPSSGATWTAFVEAVAKEKISLGDILQKCVPESRSGGGWTVRFARVFDLEMAKRSQDLLDRTLAAFAGGGAKIELALGASAAAPTDIVDPAIPESPGGAPAGARWKDVTDGAGSAGHLKAAESVFGGKARFVKKAP